MEIHGEGVFVDLVAMDGMVAVGFRAARRVSVVLVMRVVHMNRLDPPSSKTPLSRTIMLKTTRIINSMPTAACSVSERMTKDRMNRRRP